MPGATLVFKPSAASVGRARVVSEPQCLKFAIRQLANGGQPDIARFFYGATCGLRRLTQASLDFLLICPKRVAQIQQDCAALVAVTVGRIAWAHKMPLGIMRFWSPSA